ncbi:MAG TPA: pyridoxal phosphate-dependent aminotransferase [Candidatus Acidoferrales bacterium]|nr:pyridoxal phosphate-dependent aminotransferase [Candidatus Acidoferrales bacterium]
MFAERTNWNLEPNRLSRALARHRESGKPLLDLTASNPTACGFACDRQAILAALASPAALAYQPDPRGLESARRAVAAYYAAAGADVPAEDIFLTTSTSEAYSFVFRTLCDPGDELLVPAPSYPLLGFLADIQDVRLRRYPLVYEHGWQIDFQALERAMSPRTRGILLVHPNNPTGHFTGHEEAARLDEICAGREIALIADEVFRDFAYQSHQPASFAANSAALTFTISGLSKISGLPQMKASWVVTNGPEQRKGQALERLEVIADTYLSMSAPVQLAIPVFLELRRGFQKQVLERVRKNLAALDGQLTDQKPCQRLKVEGGWYVVLRVPATRPDEDLAVELLETQSVYIHPGHFYDFSGDGWLVASLIAPEPDFAEGMRRLLAMF